LSRIDPSKREGRTNESVGALDAVCGRIEVEIAIGNQPRLHGMHLNRNRLPRRIVRFRFSASGYADDARTPNTGQRSSANPSFAQ
jgi:hypothetical protein